MQNDDLVTYDARPDASIYYALRNDSRVSAGEAVSELLDNSADAGAKHVSIIISDEKLTISDDGRGCSDLGAMFRLGGFRQDRVRANEIMKLFPEPCALHYGTGL